MNDSIQKNRTSEVCITLKEITDLISVRHDKAMLKVKALTKEPSFGEVSKVDTLNLNNVKVITYMLTKKQAIAVGAKLNNALLMKVIDKVEELTNQSQKVLTTSEQISLIAQGHQITEQRLNSLEHKVDNDITLTSAQKHNIKQRVNTIVFKLKENHNLNDDFTPKCYSRVWKKVKNHFIVSSYMEIPKSKFDELVSIVDSITFADVM